MDHYEIVIIGAGIAGASLAYALVQSPVTACGRILVVEAEGFPGYHTTGRSAALYSALYGSGVIRALTAASRGFFEHPPAGFTQYPLLTPRGCLHIAGPGKAGALDDLLLHAQRLHQATFDLDGRTARKLVPILLEDRVERAVHEPDARDIDVHGLHQGYLRAARAAGVVIRMDARVTALFRGQEHWIVDVAGTRVSAGTVVNAAGAWADEIAGRSGVGRIGLRPLRRTAVLVDPPSGHDIHAWPAVIDAEETFYFKPDAGMILASPADETPSAPCDAQPDEMDIAVCIDRIQRSADLPVRRVGRKWAGLRNFVADRNPVVGYAADDDRFFWLAAQGGYGIQTAPAMADLAAALLRRENVPQYLAAYGVDAADLSPRRPAVTDI